MTQKTCYIMVVPKEDAKVGARHGSKYCHLHYVAVDIFGHLKIYL